MESAAEIYPARLRIDYPERLDRLTPEQWKDAFRAAGYTESDGDRYIARLRQKVADGLAVREHILRR